MRGLALLCFGVTVSAISAPTAAADLDTLLHCRDAAALAQDDSHLADAARNAGFACREHAGPRSARLSCSDGTARVLGAPVREFERARMADGGVILSVVLNSTPAAVQSRLPQMQTRADGSAGLHVELDTREDGRAEFRCRLDGDRPPHGAIAGRLDFRGQQPLPAMRVCATAVTRQPPPRCVQTVTGQREYVIDELPAGDYYLTAFPTENNPNRLFSVYTQPMAGCMGSQCERGRLQPVTVLPGDVQNGIDPVTLLPELPAILRVR